MKKIAYILYSLILFIAVILTSIAIYHSDKSVVSPFYIMLLANAFYSIYAYRKARKL